MALSHNSSTSDQATSVTSLGVAHNAGAGSDKILVITSGASTGSIPTISDVTYFTDTVNELAQQTQATSIRVSMHYVIAPSSGNRTGTVTWSATVDECCVGITSYTGGHQTTPFGTPVSASGTASPASVSGISSASGEVCLDIVYCLRTTMTEDGGQTQLWIQESIASTTSGGGSSEPGAASVAMSWTLATTGFSDQWAMIGASLAPSTPAADPSQEIPHLMHPVPHEPLVVVPY